MDARKEGSPFGTPAFSAAATLVSTVVGAGAALAFGPIGAAAAAIVACAAAFFLLKRASPAAAAAADPAAPMAIAAAVADIPPDRVDALTGLANENGLMAWFAEKGPRLAADGMGLVVLTAKLENFSAIERGRGKAVSDAVLKEIAARVGVVAGGDGIAARTDGEEFASVVAVVPARAAQVASERAGHLVELVCRPVEVQGSAVWVGGCVGAAHGSPLDGPGTLERAREALKRASRLGTGQYVVAS